MKKVLLTNFSVTQYSGSELDTITMANYFLKEGYDVTIFTIEYGYPLLKIINEKIKIVDYDNTDNLENHYDLIWAHHFPLLDYLLFNKKITVDYIHYISLSAYMGYEAFPSYYKELNCVSILSKEAKDLAKEEGYDISKIDLFTNYSYENYFKNKKNLSERLERICVVSNHIPTELLDFSKIAKKNKIKVDIYGIGYKYKKVDDKLLSKYDVIISIGKTINYGLSLGIPCYCYDRFGGDGYITKNNIEKSYNYNFSGRYSNIVKTAEEIYNEIINEYDTVITQSKELKKFAYDNFCYEKMMERKLLEIYKTPKFDLDHVLRKYSCDIRRNTLFFQTVGYKTSILKMNNIYPLEYCKFYYEKNNEFSEINTEQKVFSRLGNNKYKVKIKVPKDVHKIRFDFSEKPFTKVNDIIVNKDKIIQPIFYNCIKYKGGYLSINNDPSIVIYPSDFPKNNLEIIIDMEFLQASDVVECLLDEIHSKDQIIQQRERKSRLKSLVKRIIRKK